MVFHHLSLDSFWNSRLGGIFWGFLEFEGESGFFQPKKPKKLLRNFFKKGCGVSSFLSVRGCFAPPYCGHFFGVFCPVFLQDKWAKSQILPFLAFGQKPAKSLAFWSSRFLLRKKRKQGLWSLRPLLAFGQKGLCLAGFWPKRPKGLFGQIGSAESAFFLFGKRGIFGRLASAFWGFWVLRIVPL